MPPTRPLNMNHIARERILCSNQQVLSTPRLGSIENKDDTVELLPSESS